MHDVLRAVKIQGCRGEAPLVIGWGLTRAQVRWGRGDVLWGVCFTIERLRVILETGTVNFGLASAEFIVYASAAYNACGVYFGDKGEVFF